MCASFQETSSKTAGMDPWPPLPLLFPAGWNEAVTARALEPTADWEATLGIEAMCGELRVEGIQVPSSTVPGPSPELSLPGRNEPLPYAYHHVWDLLVLIAESNPNTSLVYRLGNGGLSQAGNVPSFPLALHNCGGESSHLPLPIKSALQPWPESSRALVFRAGICSHSLVPELYPLLHV